MEHTHAEWIRLNLSNYEPTWAEFIGNDGKNAPNPKRKLRAEFAEKHPLFAQMHYTMMFSLVRMERVRQRLDTLALARIKAGRAEACSYVADIDQYFLFMAYMGNATDQALKLDELLEGKAGSQETLQKFYDFRHTVIHGPRVPVKTTDFELYVPRLKERPKDGDWQKGVAWGSVGDASFMPVTDFCAETLREFLKAVNLVHGRVRGRIADWFEPEERSAAVRPLPAFVEQKTLYDLITHKPTPPEDMEGRGIGGSASSQPRSTST